MKKIILFVLFVLISGNIAYAEEMIVNLTSGNAVVVQYTGSIQGVTLKGTTDAIAGVSMPQATSPAAAAVVNQQDSGKEQAVIPQDKKKEVKNKAPGIRFKWADPITED